MYYQFYPKYTSQQNDQLFVLIPGLCCSHHYSFNQHLIQLQTRGIDCILFHPQLSYFDQGNIYWQCNPKKEIQTISSILCNYSKSYRKIILCGYSLGASYCWMLMNQLPFSSMSFHLVGPLISGPINAQRRNERNENESHFFKKTKHTSKEFLELEPSLLLGQPLELTHYLSLRSLALLTQIQLVEHSNINDKIKKITFYLGIEDKVNHYDLQKQLYESYPGNKWLHTSRTNHYQLWLDSIKLIVSSVNI